MPAPLLHPRAVPPRVRQPLLAVGVDHHLAPLELRERVALSAAEHEAALRRLVARPEVEEAFLLTTCNRTEAYVLPRDPEGALAATLDVVFARAPELLAEGRYRVRRGDDAARHLLAIACGLESMVLGEPEILGQVRRAGELAERLGASGTVVRRLVRTAVGTGARARNETGIGAGAVSLGYATVELARHIFVGLSGRSCLVLGGGEMATAVAQALAEKGLADVRFALRSDRHTARLREEVPGAVLVPFPTRYTALTECDLLVTATSADEVVVEADEVRRVMRQRRSRPLLVVDLGVPRNVDPRVADLSNVFAHDLDSLQHLIGRNLAQRREQVPLVEAIVGEELLRFDAWCQGLDAEPLVAELQRRAERIRAAEVSRARERFPAETHDELEKLTRVLVRKLLHHPSARLRGEPGRDTPDFAQLELARDLFQLDEDDER
jgi:glutamyl-tRNA reductase